MGYRFSPEFSGLSLFVLLIISSLNLLINVLKKYRKNKFRMGSGIAHSTDILNIVCHGIVVNLKNPGDVDVVWTGLAINGRPCMERDTNRGRLPELYR